MGARGTGCDSRHHRAAARAELPAPRQCRRLPTRQGSGLGRRLLAFAEAEALRRGYCEIRLYTHQTMVENQRLYTSIGYEETGCGTEAGYDRVFMRKQLRG
jgi:GNAT superfamily N-acetyltransferase